MVKQIFSLLLLAILSINFVYSQGKGEHKRNHERMKAQKIAYITDALELTPSESEKFWPVYHEFKKQHDVYYEQKHGHDNLDGISEEDAKALLNKSIKQDKQQIALKEKYNVKFLECIPAKKLVKLRGIERKFRKEVLNSIRDRYKSRDKTEG